jgi:arsenite methyltransferase
VRVPEGTARRDMKQSHPVRNVKEMVREGYGKIAAQSCSCCGSGDCAEISQKVGYEGRQLGEAPEDANLGLGCGNPTAIASIRAGDTVLDLGSGAGLDCFLAAAKVGPRGQVIGVDMTPGMIERATRVARDHGYGNVEFRLGEIEHLPVEDGSVDLILSNCVINLSPDKPQVFDEAFRVLKPGGRLCISDLVLTGALPDRVRSSVAAYIGCLSGAIRREEYLQLIGEAGFSHIDVIKEQPFPMDCMLNDETAKVLLDDPSFAPTKGGDLASLVRSITLAAEKRL